MTSAIVLVAALALDRWLGEPARFHPLVGFGHVAKTIESMLYGDSCWRGTAAVLLAVMPPVALAALLHTVRYSIALDIALLYVAIGWRSLNEHAAPVGEALQAGELARARERVGRIVSRDTTSMQPGDVAKAAVESVLENGNDAVFGAIFWFLIAGAPGVVAYRLTNTLDAMWGYRNERYRRFGWAAARLDDVLNYVPARLTAFSYALAGRTRLALRCWRTQAGAWKSPNAGPVMAAGAGSLGVTLGGGAWYHGAFTQRPTLGAGAAPTPVDIGRALRLVTRCVWIWSGVWVGGILLVERIGTR